MLPSGERWPTVTIQLTILGINTSFLLRGMVNVYILASFMVVLSIFILQSISRRFLLLYPFNGFMKRPTPDVDTYILSGLIWLSSLFLFFGALKNSFSFLEDLNPYLFGILAVVVLIILPTVWKFWANNEVRERVTERLQENTLQFHDKCPQCQKKIATITNQVIARNQGRCTVDCPDCKVFEIDVPITIAY